MIGQCIKLTSAAVRCTTSAQATTTRHSCSCTAVSSTREFGIHSLGTFVPTRTSFALISRAMAAPNRRDGRISAIDDLRITLDQLEVDRAVLVGLSGGARIAIDFAIWYPSRVVKLVAAAPGLSGYNDWALPEERVRAGRDALRADDRSAAARAWLELWAPVTGAALLKRGLDNADSLFMNAELIDLDPPAIGRLNEITAPTLVIVGDKDLADILVIADLIAEGVSRAEKRVIEGADHFPNIHDPATFNRLVADLVELDR
jgi:3-oxoadipate enol-lactonase